MSCSNGNDVWDWESHEYYIEDNTTIEIPNSLLNGVSENADDISYTFNNETTPVKACGDLAYHVTSNEVMEKESEQCKEPSSQVKRRRMLQFDSEVLDAPPFNDDAFLRSKETQESLADALSEMSEWAAGFAAEGTSASIDECLDPSSEGWIADCINDAEMHFCTEEMASDPSEDVQIDITELCNSPPQFDATQVKKNPVRTHQNVIFKGKKSYIRTPPKLASSVVYPFTFIKPCAIHGDMTLKDINQKIHNPPKSKPNEDDPSVSYPTSAFSGKPVVGKTKIRTEGGKGSITIMRTKG